MTATHCPPGGSPALGGPVLLADYQVFHELTAAAEENLERHLRHAEDWMPQDYVPWGQGRDFTDLPWAPGQSPLPEAAQVAFEVNLLTEDNLPSYHHVIASIVGTGGVWGTWMRRWTAEEGRHSIVMRDYLMVARGIDPVALERGRMHQVQHGFAREDPSPLSGLVYTAIQELATRISHRNTGRYAADPIAERLLTRVAADENLHMLFYRDVVAAALDVSPSRMIQAIAAEVSSFQMPGTGIPDFAVKAMKIANAGIYDLRIHRDEVLLPLLRHWRFFDRSGLDPDAERAQTDLAAFLAGLERLASRYEERRAERAGQHAAVS
jgi:acyl-[acyl-carrier protein] desaturase